MTPAKPTVPWGARVSPEVDQLRRQLQQATGWPMSRLMTEALQVLAPRVLLPVDRKTDRERSA
jgi:hypothetical protein